MQPLNERPLIRSADDLPRHSIPIQGTLQDLLLQEKFLPFAKEARLLLEGDLRSYRIEDRSTLKRYRKSLLQLYLIEGDFASTAIMLRELIALEDKEAIILARYLEMKAHLLSSLEKVEGGYRESFRRHFEDEASLLSWSKVSHELKLQKGMFEFFDEKMVLEPINSLLQPMVQATGALDGLSISQMIQIYYTLTKSLPVADIIIDVIRRLIQRNDFEKQEIWTARSITLELESESLHSVKVAIWDTGVDPLTLEGRLARPFSEKDHHIAYDMFWKKTEGMLPEIKKGALSTTELQSHLKGFMDLISGCETEESKLLQTKIKTLSQEEIPPFLEAFAAYSNYCHGTHVCTIAIKDNPMVELITARLTVDTARLLHLPTLEEAQNGAASFQKVVRFFQHQGVRVVNMSWVLARSFFEHSLNLHGIPEAKLRARELFDIMKTGLFEAISSSEEILFIAGSGNSDNDVIFDEFIPAMFNLPNLLVVGAVDQGGDPAIFTSYGTSVQLYANGVEVEGLLPGGISMKLSGSSMSAPNVTNLAAKLLAITPELKVKELVTLILEGCEERSSQDKVVRLLHPRRSLDLLRQWLTTRTRG